MQLTVREPEDWLGELRAAEAKLGRIEGMMEMPRWAYHPWEWRKILAEKVRVRNKIAGLQRKISE